MDAPRLHMTAKVKAYMMNFFLNSDDDWLLNPNFSYKNASIKLQCPTTN